MTEQAEPVVTCANCGRAFRGRFCPDCGQEVQDLGRPLREIVREFFGDFLAFDARIWATLVPLVTHPGSLTRDYLDGRRARYVPPLRLYVFAGFVYFTVMALTGGGPFAPVITSGNDGTVISMQGVELKSGPSPQEEKPGQAAETVESEETGNEPGISSRFRERAATVARDQHAFRRSLIGSLSYAHFLLMPIFALLLKGFYRRRYYIEHLIFSLHFHAFVLLPGAVVALLPVAPNDVGGRSVVSAWLLVLAGYLFVSMRRVYGGSRGRTAFRLAGLGCTYSVIAGIVILGVAAGTIWFY